MRGLHGASPPSSEGVGLEQRHMTGRGGHAGAWKRIPLATWRVDESRMPTNGSATDSGTPSQTGQEMHGLGDPAPLVHTTITITAVVLLILKAKVNPALALVFSAIYLGIVCGLGAEHTLAIVNKGFGDLMAKVGLLIVFGVLLGTLLSALGAIEKLMKVLLRTLTRAGAVRLRPADGHRPPVHLLRRAVGGVRAAGPVGGGPYRVGRSSADGGGPCPGPGGGCAGPGIGTMALAGLLDIPLGVILLYGLPVAAVTIVLALLLFSALVKRGFWDPERAETWRRPRRPARPGKRTRGKSRRPAPVAALALPAADRPGHDRNRRRRRDLRMAFARRGLPLQSDHRAAHGPDLCLADRATPAARVAIGEVFTQGYRTTGQILVLRGVAAHWPPWWGPWDSDTWSRTVSRPVPGHRSCWSG